MTSKNRCRRTAASGDGRCIFSTGIRCRRRDCEMSDSSERMQKGIALVGRLLGADAGRTTPMSDEFRRFTIEHLFGEVWQGEGLALEERSLLTRTGPLALARGDEPPLPFPG